MPKRIVICCDGTGNRDNDVDNGRRCVSNVRRLYEMLLPYSQTGWRQVAWYDAGVGTGTSGESRRLGMLSKASTWVGAQMPARILGIGGQLRTAMELGFGVGISENIAQGYREIVRQYVRGDEIFLFGFSRGAYTARCVAGVIARCGLLRAEHIRFADDVVRLYRYRHNPSEDVSLRRELVHPRVTVRFLGIWDTVASLGVPLWGWWFRFGSSNKSFDTSAVSACEVVRHVLSIDEQRSQFMPMMFREGFIVAPPASGDIQEMWFRGSHAGVGGGYADREMSDGPLAWMIAEARKSGLEFDETAMAELRPVSATCTRSSSVNRTGSSAARGRAGIRANSRTPPA